MIDFQFPTLSDKAWVDDLLCASAQRASDYNFTNLYAWGPTFKLRIARLDHRLAVQLIGPTGYSYLWPVGRGSVKDALLELQADAAEWNRPFQLIAVTQEQKQALESLFPGQFHYSEVPSDFDYLYEINRLADLKGKKLHAKRNHINRFLKENPSWVYQEITPETLCECLKMDEQWYRRSRIREGITEETDLHDEGLALRRATDHFEALGLEGGLIRVYGEVIAFTIGDTVCKDTFDVHFEKAYNELQGSYAMINRCFARQVRERHPEIVYINRENDMGIEGLRKAKQSYYPDPIVAKYSALKINN